MNEHEHDDPGWSPDCHDCHEEDGYQSATCEDCIAITQAWEDALEVQRAAQLH